MFRRFHFLFSCILIPFLLDAQTISGTIEFDGITRDYILHLPTDYDDNKTYPFVYNLHGFTSNAAQQQFYSGMDATADENGFIVCYPNGIDASWNVGWAFGSTADDIGFLVELVDVLSLEYSINTERLYSCGMSNGGFMSYKLACDASDKFAAVASVTGAMVSSELNSCDPSRQMPVMQIHGTEDPTVAYGGSFVSEPIEDVVNFWVDDNGCNTPPDTIYIEDVNPSDGCTAQRIQYSDCEDNKEVVFYKIEGGEHTWPDAALTIGVTNRDFNASQEIWNFFNRFDLNGYIISSNENVKPEESIVLSPNPASSQISLSNLPIGSKQISIIDALGKVMVSHNSSSMNISPINVDNLNNGLYFLIVEGKDTKEVVKFMKL